MPEAVPQDRFITDRDDYLARFSAVRKAALDRAHDIRKFEIELYWKRAAYFWAFSAVALAGYLSTSGDTDRSNTFIICCLGFLFSLSWYLVNRGSSYWQRNWEKHVDLLEDEIEGPLHKLVIDRQHFNFSDLSGPYRFSPARMNTILSMMFLVLWSGLAARTLLIQEAKLEFWHTAAFFGIITLATALHMIRKGRTGLGNKPRTISFVLRDYG
jgi:hypothetical protein